MNMEKKEKILSNKQTTVMTLFAQGLVGKQVALEMKISESTLRHHIDATKRKLRAKTFVHAIVLALQLGEIEVTDASV